MIRAALTFAAGLAVSLTIGMIATKAISQAAYDAHQFQIQKGNQ